MNKKRTIFISLVIGSMSLMLVGKVLAASGDKAGLFLNSKEFVWVGNSADASLKPIALTGKLSRVITQKEYALSFAIEKTVNTLLTAKTASTAQAKQYFTEAINLTPQSELIDGNRVLAKTGGSGVVEFNAEKGRYALQIAPIASVNINLPSSVKVDLDEYIIPIGINNSGNGTVKKIASSDGLIKEASAEEPVRNSKVKVVTYFDKNNNGKWDSDENVAPWAGVRVDLINLGKQSGISLSDEWKDVYLDRAKAGLNASDLVNDLSKNCPTAGVSTVDGDTRKTFLKREGEVLGDKDFEITSGKVYSIKGCEVPFYMIGYDMDKQLKK